MSHRPAKTKRTEYRGADSDATGRLIPSTPVELCIGTTPGSAAGYGQFFDINRITLTNAATGNMSDDDFTQDDVLNTALWNPVFSLDAAGPGSPGSVFQVSTNTLYWVNWTVPDDLFALTTKASLKGGTNAWFSPTIMAVVLV